MGRAGTIARRTFLIGSAAIAGGVAFGAYKASTPHPNPLLDDLEADEAAITPYVKIDPGGITLITPRADKGQGAYSIQAAMIAEELDVELDQVNLDPGKPAPAYWNTAVADPVVPFYTPEGDWINNIADILVSAGIKLYGLQITGGSSTVADSYTKLRTAGAVARETLKEAASRRIGIARADLRTEKGQILLSDGTRIPYTDLAAEAAKLEPVTDVDLRDPAQWRLLGKAMQRVDVAAKSTGTQDYGIDLQVPGMKHATVVLSPHSGGKVAGFDPSAALSMRGVSDVVPVSSGVAVIADNTWRAFEASRKIAIDWEPISESDPRMGDMDTHWQSLSNSLDDRYLDSRVRDDGDVESALADAEVLMAEYRAPYLAHAPLEPASAIVRVDDDGVEVWAGTQIPRFVQTNVASITGFDDEQVKLHVAAIGGSFGHRLEDRVIRLAAEIALQVKGTPIKLVFTREQDMAQEYVRQASVARMRGAVDEGQVNSLDLQVAMPSVMSSQFGRQGIPPFPWDFEIVAGAWEQPFAIPNQRISGYRAPEIVPLSSWRSVGASTNGFFYNSALDELIHAAGADPLAERLRLCNDPLAVKVLEAVAEMSNWSGVIGGGKGRGVALTRSFDVQCAQVVEVTNTPAGIRIDKVWAAAEVGKVLDPVNFDNQVKGGVIFGLAHAMNCELTYTDGVPDQDNFHVYEGMRFYQCPSIEVRGLENGDRILGIGEPPVPPAAPALASAIFAATGKRIRELPFNKHIDFT